MTARKLIAAVTADHSHGQAATRISQGRQQAESSLVSPLQVVQEQGHVTVPGRADQDRADGRRKCREVRFGRRGTQLGDDLREKARD